MIKNLGCSWLSGCLLFLALWLFAVPAWGGDVFMQVWNTKVIDAQTVAETAEVCSAAMTTWRNLYQSVQWRATSVTGTAAVRVYVQASIDEVNFVVPDGVSDLAVNDTGEVWRIAGVYLPMVRQIKVCVKGNAANPADTVATVWLGRQ